MKLATFAALAALGMASFAAAESSPNNRLSVHEWGTFTVLQNEKGQSIGGVNTDDEPVPDFVHSLDGSFIENVNRAPNMFSKSFPRCDPSVTVRLETPVLYFHAPPGFNSKIDVDVQFRGGLLTQYYPDAVFNAPGLEKGFFKFDALTDRTLGSLGWHGLALGKSAEGPKTTDPVWLSPRKVKAADITAVSGESERFIFYRGVGHVQTPVRVFRTDDIRHLRIQGEAGSSAASTPALGDAWLVDVRDDGRIAFRATRGDAHGEALVDATFSPAEYSTDPADLRKSLGGALVADGLFADEADALLTTWDVSYFRRPGLRLFYLVPQEWTDSVLPLKVTSSGKPLDTQTERVMVGRIEIITPEQRNNLSIIARGPASNPSWLYDELNRPHADGEWFAHMMAGGIPDEIQTKMPADYRAYVGLGRFRNAIILDEMSKNPAPSLKSFVNAYALVPTVTK